MATLVDAGIRPFLIGRAGCEIEPVTGADLALRWDTAGDLAKQLANLKDPIVLNIAGYFVSKHVPADIPTLIASNLEFPIKISEAITLSATPRIVNVGTSWEYSDTGVSKAANLYAQIKALNAVTLEWYAQYFPLQALNLKLNDTYGGDDTRSKLMPLLHSCAQEKKTITLNAWAQRLNLLHIADVQEGIMAAALHTDNIAPGNVQEAFILGEETISLGNIIEMIKSGPAPHLSVSFKDMRRKNTNLRDVWTDAPRLPNWQPRIALKEGLDDYFRGIL